MPRSRRARRGRVVARRRVVFVGGEGPSERAFARFLQQCCTDAALNVHLRSWEGSGGDSLSVVRDMTRFLKRQQFAAEVATKLVLLDEDRIAEDNRNGRDARAFARQSGIGIVLQTPNLEGVLLRLHPNNEQRVVSAHEAERELKRVWPGYRKPPISSQLSKRFSVDDLRRAAKYDPELRHLLATIGLMF